MADYQRARDKEEDTSVTSLVEAAPRIKVHSIKILIKTITKEVPHCTPQMAGAHS